MLNSVIQYFLRNPLVTAILALLFVGLGLVTTPFEWNIPLLPSDPVAVDAIPDIGENQQIVFTSWDGRSPQDIDDQITYPLTTALMGIPGVRTVRSSSMFGFSSIYLIFEEDVEFYWSRSRILEKLNSLPPGTLPQGVQPSLGPDATALGQVFWYTLEGRDEDGQVTGGWDLHELRSIQDFHVKYALSGASGVSEVASIGGHVQEYIVEVQPDALEQYQIGINEVARAVGETNQDIGAQTLEVNMAEYLVRGIGLVKSIKDIEQTVVREVNNTPILISDLAHVSIGPATRRGVLDKGGAEVVGGVVVARFGSNPLKVINSVKSEIEKLSRGLPKKILDDGRESQVTIVPFYDRTKLIRETIGTLEEALSLEVLITFLVIIALVFNFRASITISILLPLAVIMVFFIMKAFHIDANIVALSGIAIAIGTMVDLGIIMVENIVRHLKLSAGNEPIVEVVGRAASEVSGAIITAVSTTIVSFIPVFTLQAAEGKLFRPLAFTKTFALFTALVVALIILPCLARWIFSVKSRTRMASLGLHLLLIIAGFLAMALSSFTLGIAAVLLGVIGILKAYARVSERLATRIMLLVALSAIIALLAEFWTPLGPAKSGILNFIFVALLIVLILGFFYLLERYYQRILNWCLSNKRSFLLIPLTILLFGLLSWQGFNRVFGFVASGASYLGADLRQTQVWINLENAFPGMGEEFMPSLDEGSFLLMPTSMPHAGMEQNQQALRQLDMRVAHIPEVEIVVGKLGRVESPLDPAPISMYENIINYRPEYSYDENGRRIRYRTDENGHFVSKKGAAFGNDEALEKGLSENDFVVDEDGEFFRNWRSKIKTTDDIWSEIAAKTAIPGVTSAPKLQPIETRLVMLQTGMRAPMGIKIHGSDLSTIEQFGWELEQVLKEVKSVKKEAVFADRIVGKPYIHLNIDRNQIAQYGLTISKVQSQIHAAVGGQVVAQTIEGRERFNIRVRYPRELRNTPQKLGNILVSTRTGALVPLSELCDIEYIQGPQVIKSEDTFLTGYVLFDRLPEYSEVEVVEAAAKEIQRRIDTNVLSVPSGISYEFTGTYENQVRAENRLRVIVPLVLLIIFLILYFQFRSVATSLMIFAGIFMAFSGAFVLLWFYGQDWFLNFSFMGTSMQDLFRIHPINLSVAVWVGFIALFGIATDDGVLIGTYLDQSFARNKPKSKAEIRAAVVEAGSKRIRPAVMTSATTLIALLPVLTSTGRGADIMIPMAIPAFGGMIFACVTYFLVPVLYCSRSERQLRNQL